jgi:hypothetical protein
MEDGTWNKALCFVCIACTMTRIIEYKLFYDFLGFEKPGLVTFILRAWAFKLRSFSLSYENTQGQTDLDFI